MNRITLGQLEAVVKRINYITNSPLLPWVKTEDGKMKSQIGCYLLDGAYGGYALHRMVSKGGGIQDVFRCGHVSKRELFNLMQAFLIGLDTKS